MEENEFFRFVWRFNGLIPMIAGVIAIGVPAFAGYKIIKDVTRERNARNIVNVQEENNIKEKMAAFKHAPFGMSLLTYPGRYRPTQIKTCGRARHPLTADLQLEPVADLAFVDRTVVADPCSFRKSRVIPITL
jgi:hypothetical protein